MTVTMHRAMAAQAYPERAALTSPAKRVFDIVVAGSALIILSPLVLFTALLVAISFGRPLFHRSYRAGLHAEDFLVWKFRTMTNACDAQGALLSDEQRLTKMGRLIRRLSLDELPQLFNIVRGDMSIVGPRPLPSLYLNRYSASQRVRLEVRPGLTGLAQINGRNNLSWSKRLALDTHYVEAWTFGMDLGIMLRTVGKVLKADGVSADGISTGHEFLGNEVEQEREAQRQVA
jgi:sugar transferase EpsL